VEASLDLDCAARWVGRRYDWFHSGWKADSHHWLEDEGLGSCLRCSFEKNHCLIVTAYLEDHLAWAARSSVEVPWVLDQEEAASPVSVEEAASCSLL
jgi:hypothetical protein